MYPSPGFPQWRHSKMGSGLSSKAPSPFHQFYKLSRECMCARMSRVALCNRHHAQEHRLQKLPVSPVTSLLQSVRSSPSFQNALRLPPEQPPSFLPDRALSPCCRLTLHEPLRLRLLLAGLLCFALGCSRGLFILVSVSPPRLPPLSADPLSHAAPWSLPRSAFHCTAPDACSLLYSSEMNKLALPTVIPSKLTAGPGTW